MPRRVKLKTLEMGDLELYLIYQTRDTWEPYWRALQGAEITSLLTVVSKETMDHAFAGWSKPLIKALGIPPVGALRKLPHTECFLRADCPFYDRGSCTPKAKALRHCFELEGMSDEVSRKLGSELVRLWKEGVYIVLVQEGGT